MKKQLLALAIFGTGLAHSQVWSEDFNSTTAPAIPSTWTQNNVDGLTVTSALSAWNFGTNAWVTRDMSALYPGYGKSAASTSYYSPIGTSSDWLISPQFTVPANAVLEWDAIAFDGFYPDGYQVKISTTGTAVANFTTNLFTIGDENDTWTNRGVSLTTYSGQTVYVAFVNNANDKFILLLDNIKVIVPQTNDGSVRSITGISRYRGGAGTQNITGSFKSFGYTPASNAVLNYKVNNGATTTQTITFGTPLNYGQTANYSFSAPANMALGVNKIKTWVTHVNGNSEVALANDTAYSVVYVASTTKPRNSIIEEWSSSTCAPCANLNSSFDPLVNSNNPNTGGSLNIIKYQVNWPSPGNDPSYNNHGLARRTHYDVNAAPTSIIDGTSEMNSHSQAEIDAAIALPAFADITATLSAKSTTVATAATTIAASATITPYLSIPVNSPLRVFQAIVQSAYNYTSGTTSQKDYFHVMRKMNPDGWGSAVTVNDGTPFTVTFNHNAVAAPVHPTPAQFSFNSWTTPADPKNAITYEYVVFLQDTISDDILQSASWNASVTLPATVSTIGVKEVNSNQQIGVYPNPANEFAVILIQTEKTSKVDVTIFDGNGKLVYSNKGANLDSGKHEMTINTTELATGVYNVVVKTGDAELKEKLIINK